MRVIWGSRTRWGVSLKIRWPQVPISSKGTSQGTASKSLTKSLILCVQSCPPTWGLSPKSLMDLEVCRSSRFYSGSFHKEAEVVSRSWGLQGTVHRWGNGPGEHSGGDLAKAVSCQHKVDPKGLMGGRKCRCRNLRELSAPSIRAPICSKLMLKGVRGSSSRRKWHQPHSRGPGQLCDLCRPQFTQL